MLISRSTGGSDCAWFTRADRGVVEQVPVTSRTTAVTPAHSRTPAASLRRTPGISRSACRQIASSRSGASRRAAADVTLSHTFEPKITSRPRGRALKFSPSSTQNGAEEKFASQLTRCVLSSRRLWSPGSFSGTAFRFSDHGRRLNAPVASTTSLP